MKNTSSTVHLSGLTCEACKKVTEKRIARIQGVQTVNVDPTTGETTIIADHAIQPEEITKVLEGTHYKLDADFNN
ncbi:MAG: Heavy-metal-associated domain [Candidatus Parcubacteria bacterium]|jgi:copper chaperone CopZ